MKSLSIALLATLVLFACSNTMSKQEDLFHPRSAIQMTLESPGGESVIVDADKGNISVGGGEWTCVTPPENLKDKHMKTIKCTKGNVSVISAKKCLKNTNEYQPSFQGMYLDNNYGISWQCVPKPTQAQKSDGKK